MDRSRHFQRRATVLLAVVVACAFSGAAATVLSDIGAKGAAEAATAAPSRAAGVT